MDSFEDLFPEEKPEARQALLDLFPEETEELRSRRADEILERIYPKIEATIARVAEALQEDLEAFRDEIHGFPQSVQELSDRFKSFDTRLNDIKRLEGGLQALKRAMSDLSPLFDAKVDQYIKRAKEDHFEAKRGINELKDKLPFFKERIEYAHFRIDKMPKAYDDTELQEELKDLRKLLLNIPRGGGGNMNRNIAIQGNTSVLSRYTDINFKAGANVTLTYSNNDSTKFTDITITSSGGSSGGGISRSINNISTSQAAGFSSATDYVYLCTGTLTLTMPDASAANTNLYTIKNVGTGVVTIATTSAQTIDNQAGIQIGVQYTSVDLESNGSNWVIT